MAWQWDQITALSSVIGVAGGLISVYFVILEIRRTAQATEGATVQALMSLEKDVFSLLANNAALCLRGNARVSKLSAAEKFRYERLVALQMSMYYSAFVQFGRFQAKPIKNGRPLIMHWTIGNRPRRAAFLALGPGR